MGRAVDDQKFELTLTGPAKIDGVSIAVGETVIITRKLAMDLADAGALPPDIADRLAGASALNRSADFDNEVAEAAKVMADVMTSAAIEEAIASRIGEIEKGADERISLIEGEHRAELEAVDHELDAARAQIIALEARVEALVADLSSETTRANAAEEKLTEAAKTGKPTK
jgi:hypothetical protein